MRGKVVVIVALILTAIIFMTPHAATEGYLVELNDGWSFYHEQFVTDVSESSQAAEQVSLPVEFEEMNLDKETYGTFTTTVTIPDEMVQKQMGIELPFVYSAAKIYINGEMIKAVGQTGANAQAHETELQTVIVPFIPTSTTVEIVIQLSSFEHIRGGFSAAPVIGDWEVVKRDFLLERYMTIFVGTIILVVGLTTFIIGLMNHNEKVFLTFGMFSIVVAIREVVAVPFLYHELPISLSYITATRIEYITTTIAFTLYALFIYLSYDKIFSKWVLYFNAIVLLSLTFLSIFTEPAIFQTAFFSVFPIMIVFVLYNIWIMFKALRMKLKLAKSLVLGFAFVFVGLIIDFLTGMGLIHFPPIAKFMIMLNVLFVLHSLCINYVAQMNQLRKLNKRLDDLVNERTVQLSNANEELKRLVNRDALTGVFNRHKFNEVLNDEFQLAVEQDGYLGFIMFDIDRFKQYNDFYGHLEGDVLLTHIAQAVQHILPNNVTFARYGGEEFAVILPGYTIQKTALLAEKIRQTVENESLVNEGNNADIVTVSLGCSERTKDDIDDEIDLIRVSDERLYKSKADGRNRVTAG